jgi:hypothetical protein
MSLTLPLLSIHPSPQLGGSNAEPPHLEPGTPQVTPPVRTLDRPGGHLRHFRSFDLAQQSLVHPKSSQKPLQLLEV